MCVCVWVVASTRYGAWEKKLYARDHPLLAPRARGSTVAGVVVRMYLLSALPEDGFELYELTKYISIEREREVLSLYIYIYRIEWNEC